MLPHISVQTYSQRQKKAISLEIQTLLNFDRHRNCTRHQSYSKPLFHLVDLIGLTRTSNMARLDSAFRFLGITCMIVGLLYTTFTFAKGDKSHPVEKQRQSKDDKSQDPPNPVVVVPKEPTGFHRAIVSDWPEWALVLAVGAILWVASLRQGEGKTSTAISSLLGLIWFGLVWFGLVQLAHHTISLAKSISHKKRTIPFNSAKNKQNQMKVTRYASPLHLAIAITVEYLIDNIYFIVVVLFQLFCNCSPTGKHSTYPGVILAWLGKLLLTASEEFSLWRQQVQLNSRKHIGVSGVTQTGPEGKAIIEGIKSGEIKAGQLILVENEGIVPVDGIVVASSEVGNFPALFNESTLTGESAPAAKFPINIGGSPEQVLLIEWAFAEVFFFVSASVFSL